ncbi:hypothetical protein OBK20_13055 [Empedobacter falsenii]
MNRIEIPLSKTKMLLLLFGAIGFVVLGTLFTFNPDKFVSPITRNPEIIRIAGIASVLFFGAVGIYGTRKMFDKNVGLIIDENGIFDNTNASSVGLIKWIDITEIKTEQVASTKFLLIYTDNPDFYLDKVKGFKKKLMEGNNKMYGTPLSITSTTLKYNFNDLEKILKNKLIEQREKMPNR